jgi:cytochrome c oxidase subunit 2
MCGVGHYAMKANIIVETQAEFDAWAAKQPSQYGLAHETKKQDAAPAADTVAKSVAVNN